MKRSYVTASLVVIADVVGSAALLRAPGLAVLAVPWIVGAWLARRHDRAGATVVAVAALLTLALVVPHALSRPTEFLDIQFDVVNGVAAAVALIGALRSFGSARNRVAGLAGR